MFGALIAAALATLIPPHARVNHKCYPVWNEGKTNLDVVWNGKPYKQPWTFNVKVNKDYSTCTADGCVQRLWCTDSGAVGRYTVDKTQAIDSRNIKLEYAWLLNTSVSDSQVLSVPDKENGGVLDYTSNYGASTVVVVGDTLFFYASSDDYSAE